MFFYITIFSLMFLSSNFMKMIRNNKIVDASEISYYFFYISSVVNEAQIASRYLRFQVVTSLFLRIPHPNLKKLAKNKETFLQFL